MATCSIESCGKEEKSLRKGLCQAHYRKLMKYGDPLAERPMGRPRKEGATDHRRLAPEIKAQREAERIAKRDAARAAKTHCKHGHELSPDNTYLTKRGQKVCRICQRVANQKRHGRAVDGSTPIGTWNRHKTHCIRGHEYTPENTYLIDGARVCKLCRRISYVKGKYGLDENQFAELLENQEDACAICREPFSATSVCVDHSHDNGAVRGLLCGECNLGLGKFKDSPEILLAAVQYLTN